MYIVEASLAEMAFESYYTLANARFGYACPEHRLDDSPFRKEFWKIAKLCLEQGWDVVDFVTKGFCGPLSARGMPSVCSLLRGSYTRFYSALPHSSARDDVDEELARCKFWVMNREVEGHDERPLLMAASSPLPAWFRVVYPERFDEEIVEAWGEAAKAEFESVPRRMELAGKLFPASWPKVAVYLWPELAAKEAQDDLRR